MSTDEREAMNEREEFEAWWSAWDYTQKHLWDRKEVARAAWNKGAAVRDSELQSAYADGRQDQTEADFEREMQAEEAFEAGVQAARAAAPQQAPAQPLTADQFDLIGQLVSMAAITDADAARSVADRLEALATQAAPSAPEGFVMVPRALTTEMVAAFFRSLDGPWQASAAAQARWDEMLAAAPAASGQQEQQR